MWSFELLKILNRKKNNTQFFEKRAGKIKPAIETTKSSMEHILSY